MALISALPLPDDGESTKEPAISKPSAPPNPKATNCKSSAPFPSPVPTSWATPADLSKVRANTPLGMASQPQVAAPVPLAPPPPKTPTVASHAVEPVPRPVRSKSDASSKSGGGVFKRMFGGGGGTTALPSTFGPVTDALSPSDPNHHHIKVTPATPVAGNTSPNGHGGQYVNGAFTPGSERNDPISDADHRDHRSNNAPARSRASSVKDSDATLVPSTAPPDIQSHRKTPSRASSTDGRDGRFNLKDLLGNGTKLSRKSSASSRKSDSSKGDEPMLIHGGYTSGPESVGGGGKSKSRPSSVAGESTTSLKKYGVCERAAIGKGATSVVRLAHKWDRKEEKLYAVKEFRKRRKNETDKEYVKKLTAEFCISSTLHHPNVVETVDLVQDEHQNWCEVMEYCPGGDLYAAIKRGGMSPSEVECSFKQILLGLEYLHSQGVAHRDLKPENLFFDAKGQLKIGDYGASTVYRLPWESSVHMSTGLCGSEPYIAPEQFNNQPYDARLVDIWACGVVYYCLHFQELPWRVAQLSDPLFAAYVASTQSKNPAEAECPPTINNLSPRACRPLLRKMLEPRSEKRILIEDVMRDAWIKSIEVCTLVAKPKHIHVHARQMTSGGVV
ncbi:serine/threonine-protein kinase HAL4/sat4 [Tulasnella sp. 403]|nr:serine/threonine-protein kinase HAL4/sat4 [Tulasnella sp. 403]